MPLATLAAHLGCGMLRLVSAKGDGNNLCDYLWLSETFTDRAWNTNVQNSDDRWLRKPSPGKAIPAILRWSGKERDCTWQAWLDPWLWRWPQPEGEMARWQGTTAEKSWELVTSQTHPTRTDSHSDAKHDEISSWGATAKTMKPALKVESTSKQVVTPPESVRQETLVFLQLQVNCHLKVI